MKNCKLMIIAASSGIAMATSAQAQSSVTLFGVVDMSIGSYKSGPTRQNTLGSAGVAPSRLGFRGTEDLGGGMAVEFWLETGLNPAVGAAGAGEKFFNRRATLGLKGAFGEIRLGRDNTSVYTTDWSYDAFYDTGVAGMGGSSGTPRVPGNTAPETIYRLDNSIGYILPPGLGGFFGTLQLTRVPGGGAGKFYGGSLGYAAGPFKIEGGYGETSTEPQKYEHGVLGASYDFGFLRLMGRYSRKSMGDTRYDNYSTGVQVPVGAGLLRATLARNRGKSAADGDDTTLYGVGYTHNLSKRTAVYLQTAHVSNKGRAALAVWGAPAGVAGESSSGTQFGIRHSF